MAIVFFGLLHTLYLSPTHPIITFAKRREVFFSQSWILFFNLLMQPVSSSHFLSHTLFHLRDNFLRCFELHLENQLWGKQKSEQSEVDYSSVHVSEEWLRSMWSVGREVARVDAFVSSPVKWEWRQLPIKFNQSLIYCNSIRLVTFISPLNRIPNEKKSMYSIIWIPTIPFNEPFTLAS